MTENVLCKSFTINFTCDIPQLVYALCGLLTLTSPASYSWDYKKCRKYVMRNFGSRLVLVHFWHRISFSPRNEKYVVKMYVVYLTKPWFRNEANFVLLLQGTGKVSNFGNVQNTCSTFKNSCWRASAAFPQGTRLFCCVFWEL